MIKMLIRVLLMLIAVVWKIDQTSADFADLQCEGDRTEGPIKSHKHRDGQEQCCESVLCTMGKEASVCLNYGENASCEVCPAGTFQDQNMYSHLMPICEQHRTCKKNEMVWKKGSSIKDVVCICDYKRNYVSRFKNGQISNPESCVQQICPGGERFQLNETTERIECIATQTWKNRTFTDGDFGIINGKPSSSATSTSVPSTSASSLYITLLTIGAASVLLTMLIIIIWYILRRHRRMKQSSMSSDSSTEHLLRDDTDLKVHSAEGSSSRPCSAQTSVSKCDSDLDLVTDGNSGDVDLTCVICQKDDIPDVVHQDDPESTVTDDDVQIVHGGHPEGHLEGHPEVSGSDEIVVDDNLEVPLEYDNNIEVVLEDERTKAPSDRAPCCSLVVSDELKGCHSMTNVYIINSVVSGLGTGNDCHFHVNPPETVVHASNV